MIGDLQDAGSLKTGAKDCDMLFHVAADYRLWAPPSGRDGPHQCGRDPDSFQAAGDAGIKKIVYTSSVAAIGTPENEWPSRGRPRGISDPHPDSSSAPYKRSNSPPTSWPASSPQGPARRHRQSRRPRSDSQDIKPTPDGQNDRGFSQRPHAGLRRYRNEFHRCGRCGDGALAGRRKRPRGRTLHSGK